MNTNSPQPWELEENEQSIPLLDYLQLLWFRKKTILAITLFVTLIGYIQVSEIKNVYSATSTMLVGIPETNVIDIEAVVNMRSMSHDASDEVELLKSRSLAGKVIERLSLLDYPEFNPWLRKPEESFFDFLKYLDPRTWIPKDWKSMFGEATGEQEETQQPTSPVPVTEQSAEEEQRRLQMISATNIFLGKLRVENPDWSKIIQITFNSLDPKMAARIANEIPEAYMVDRMEARFEATEKANAWLTEQLADLEKKVVESEQAVEFYRNQHGLSVDQGQSIMDAQLSELNSQLIIARAERAEIEARLDQLRRLLAGGGAGVETASEVLSSALVQQLRTQEAQAIARQSELAVEYGPKHPRMLQVQAELNEISVRIKEEVERIAISMENEAQFARTRVASLESDLKIAQGETTEQNREEIQLRALQREAAANRALYETFLNRFKETSTTQGLETTDARVISRAEVQNWPTYPNRKKMIIQYALLGFIGACALVLGLALMNPGMLSPEQVQRVLGEYVIGLIPMVSRKTSPFEQVIERPNSGLTEALNSLKFGLALSDPDNPVNSIQVTSSVPEEGKTSLSIALARVLAMSGMNVLLLDGDLRRSSIGRKLGIKGRHKGISDLVLADPNSNVAEFVVRDEKGNVDYMPPGTAEFANATDIFSSKRMQIIIDHLKQRYDLVIVDTPPVMAVADARIIGRVVDKTLFVVRWNKTPRKVARAAVDLLHRAEIDIAGVVLQQVDLDRYGRLGYGDSGYYYHYGRYGKYYSD